MSLIDRIVQAPLGDDPPSARLLYGQDVRKSLRLLPDNSVHMVATSPPYWGLRDYGGEKGVWGGDPDCDCPEHEPERCVVMDIFSGSATTGKVAMKQGRDYVGLDLNPDYLDLAYARLTGRRAPKKDAPTTDFIGDLFG